MTQAEYIRLKAKLAIMHEIAEEFRLNTSIRTVIKNIESRIKEAEK